MWKNFGVEKPSKSMLVHYSLGDFRRSLIVHYSLASSRISLLISYLHDVSEDFFNF